MNEQTGALRACTLALVCAGLAACANNPFQRDSAGASSSNASSGGTAAATPAAKPRPAWMNEAGEVIDSKKVEAGYGQKVKGLEGWEGEITGRPAAGSKFTQLQIGMGRAQVLSIVGNPTDQGAYVTGRAFIPFFFGSDRYRHELATRGWGDSSLPAPAASIRTRT